MKHGEDPGYDVSLEHSSRHTGVSYFAADDTIGGEHEAELEIGGWTTEVDVDRHPVPQRRCEFIRATDRLQVTLIEDSHPVGDSACLAEEVSGEDHGATVLTGQRSDQVGDIAGCGGVESAGWFIEE